MQYAIYWNICSMFFLFLQWFVILRLNFHYWNCHDTIIDCTYTWDPLVNAWNPPKINQAQFECSFCPFPAKLPSIRKLYWSLLGMTHPPAVVKSLGLHMHIIVVNCIKHSLSSNKQTSHHMPIESKCKCSSGTLMVLLPRSLLLAEVLAATFHCRNHCSDLCLYYDLTAVAWA